MKNRPNKILDKIIATNTARSKKDIKTWRAALQQAENVTEPKRLLLYNLYDEIILDAHLSAEIQKRVLAIKGAAYNLIDADGTPNIDATKIIQAPWFNKLLMYAVESIFYGHSLVQIGDIVDNNIDSVDLINRKHLRPESGLFVENATDDKGIYYREDEAYFKYLIEIGETHDLGLLNKCAPHILYKRFAHGAWSEFCEIFGMPLRYGTTNARDEESLNRMENMMINMAAASYAVIDNEEKIEFVETAKSDGGVYKGLMDTCNNEVSKLINGAVIGGESEGGSRSKEEVGERIASLITNADKQFVEQLINHQILPKLTLLGMPFTGLLFKFEKGKDIDQLFKFTQGLMNTFDVPTDFIQDTFGIPVIEKKEIKPIAPKDKKLGYDFFD